MAEGLRRPRGQYADIPEPDPESGFEVAHYVSKCIEEDWSKSKLRNRDIHQHVKVRFRRDRIHIECSSLAYGWHRLQRLVKDTEPTCRGWPLEVTCV